MRGAATHHVCFDLPFIIFCQISSIFTEAAREFLQVLRSCFSSKRKKKKRKCSSALNLSQVSLHMKGNKLNVNINNFISLQFDFSCYVATEFPSLLFLAPTVPTMQLNCRHLCQRFRCVTVSSERRLEMLRPRARCRGEASGPEQSVCECFAERLRQTGELCVSEGVTTPIYTPTEKLMKTDIRRFLSVLDVQTSLINPTGV